MSSTMELRRAEQVLECRRNGIIQPLLTDLYEFTMAYAYWKAGKSEEYAVFDLFFRKNPFDGEFTIFAGLNECLKFLELFHFSDSDIEYLKSTLQISDVTFWVYLQQLTPKDIKVYAIDEGNVVFPRVPLLRVEGPVVVAQLLETVLLNLVNFASLVATNAARHRLAAGRNSQIYEMGLRRAQGPDGGLSASKYSYLGGTDGTSNTLAGKLYGIPVIGTHAHSFVASFSSCDDITQRMLRHNQTGEELDFIQKCQNWRRSVTELLQLATGESSEGELAAFASYALAFPEHFVALVDTYDTIKSGIPNFCAVALALNDFGYKAIGIRLDSGDLAYLSLVARDIFRKIASKFSLDWFSSLTIMASNNINEETILSLRDQGHSIDTFGIGTHLVTCQKQPALGGVYKLVQLNQEPKVKLSETIEKVTLPGRKNPYRLYGSDGHKALIDLMIHESEPAPEKGKKILCRHPFHESKRAWVVPGRVEPLYKLYWDKGEICQVLPSLEEKKQRVTEALESLRLDHKRVLNPTPYKVAVSGKLYQFIHQLWLQHAPIGQLQ